MYVQWPENRFMRHIEGRAHSLRKAINLNPLDRLEPSRVVETMPNVVLASLLDLAGTDSEVELEILRRESEQWSAIAFREGSGPWLVTSNPWHAPTRVRVSVMEEIAHIVLEHRPTALVPHPVTGLPVRTYSPSKEKEAYGVAAAAVLPYNGLVELLRRGASSEDIAERFGVSVPLVTMRTNMTGARAAAGNVSNSPSAVVRSAPR